MGDGVEPSEVKLNIEAKMDSFEDSFERFEESSIVEAALEACANDKNLGPSPERFSFEYITDSEFDVDFQMNERNVRELYIEVYNIDESQGELTLTFEESSARRLNDRTWSGRTTWDVRASAKDKVRAEKFSDRPSQAALNRAMRTVERSMGFQEGSLLQAQAGEPVGKVRVEMTVVGANLATPTGYEVASKYESISSDRIEAVTYDEYGREIYERTDVGPQGQGGTSAYLVDGASMPSFFMTGMSLSLAVLGIFRL